jgi:O-antigen/teichoic acid export membrane protein
MKVPSLFSKVRLHPFFIDVLLSGVSQIAILVANLLIVSLISKWMGSVAVGQYLLIKRVSAWLLTSAQLGLGLALAREIAHSVEETEARAGQYFSVAFALLIPLLAIMGLATVLLPKTIAQLCFGSPNVDLVYGLAYLLAGSVLQALLFGYYRGLQRMRFANLVQVGVLVVVPLIALVAARPSKSVLLLIYATGLGMAALSIVWSIPILLKSREVKSHFLADARHLLNYGVVRVPGDIANGALLALGPILLSHYTSLDQLSYLLLGITCLTMTSMAFWPVMMMLLAKVSHLLGAGRTEDVKEYIQHLRSAVLQISFLMMTQALIFIGPLVRWWLGPSYQPGIPVISIVIFAIPGLMYYSALRSVLDAASTMPYNTRNLIVSLAVFAILAIAIIRFAPHEWVLPGVSAAMTTALYILAITTDLSLHTIELADRPPQMSSMWIVALLGAVSVTAQLAYHFEITKIGFFAVLLVNVALTLLLMRRSRPEWVAFVTRTALSRA